MNFPGCGCIHDPAFTAQEDSQWTVRRHLRRLGRCSPTSARSAKKNPEEFTKFQRELFQRLPEVSREWADRVQTEATIASEFATKLSSTRSIPEATTVCQEWAGRGMEMATADAKRILADSQKLLETGTRLISNGWLSNGRVGVTAGHPWNLHATSRIVLPRASPGKAGAG
jgi:hypothetical protein